MRHDGCNIHCCRLQDSHTLLASQCKASHCKAVGSPLPAPGLQIAPQSIAIRAVAQSAAHLHTGYLLVACSWPREGMCPGKPTSRFVTLCHLCQACSARVQILKQVDVKPERLPWTEAGGICDAANQLAITLPVASAPRGLVAIVVDAKAGLAQSWQRYVSALLTQPDNVAALGDCRHLQLVVTTSKD